MTTRLWSACALVSVAMAVWVNAQSPPSRRAPRVETADPACQAATLVSTGGAFPSNAATLAIRWTGYSNFELAYKGQVLLLDAYFDRGSVYPPLGFRAADIKRANAILIGHGHFDHMSDAASVAIRTGALVAGAPVTIEKLRTQSVEARQLKAVTGRGGETFQVGPFTIDPILGRHGDPPEDVTAAFNKALQVGATQPTPEQSKEQAAIRARGTSDPRVAAEGTIAYLITLDNGFRIAYRDSGGVVTDIERAAFSKIPGVDVALAATSAAFLNSLTSQQALEYVRTYNPLVFIPAHHDAPYSGLWRGTEPIFQSIKQENPNIQTYSKGYREPTCFITGS